MSTENQRDERKSLLRYYDEELKALTDEAAAFAKQYPEKAKHLKLQPGQLRDPHVERMLEGAAFLAGRVRARIDDDFPELTEALFGVLYPHLLRPIPSMALVQFNPITPAAAVVVVPQHTEEVARVGDVDCRFRTGYPVALWPVEVVSAVVRETPLGDPLNAYAPNPDPKVDGWSANAGLVLKFKTKSGTPFSDIKFPPPPPEADGLPKWPKTPTPPTAIRLYLSGGENEKSKAATMPLYEHLFNDVGRVVIRNPRTLKVTKKDAARRTRTHPWLRPVGFAPDEALLPYPRQAFPGYRVLTEFFAYRHKFHFVDLCGWDEALDEGVLSGSGEIEVLFYFDRELSPTVRNDVKADMFVPRCTPAVNLFNMTPEVVVNNQRRYEYEVVPDQHKRDAYEVYSIEDVVQQHPETGGQVRYEPFYTFRHQTGEPGRAYWHMRRRASGRDMVVDNKTVTDAGTDVDVSFTDLDFNPKLPADGKVLFRSLCLNRDVPGRPRASGAAAFGFNSDANHGAIRVIRPPTPTLRPPTRKGGYWRLVSHLSLNHLSITAGADEGRDALREYLRLYDFSDAQAGQSSVSIGKQVVEGLEKVDSEPAVEFVPTAGGAGFARGITVKVHLNAEKFEGIGAYLFAAVLDEFLRLYVSVNSFTQLNLFIRQQSESALVKEFPARTGTRPLF